MVSLNNVSFGYGGQAIFSNASHTFQQGCKVGLIGPNGAGKSTLFRLLTKDLLPDQGEVSAIKNLKLEHFHQDLLSMDTHETILNVVLQGFDEILQVQRKINELLLELEENYEEKKIELLGSLQSRFENMGGYSIESKSEEILVGLGFKNSDFSRPLSEFSGGWRMRAILGKILLSNPDLLLLDEPSNHLDLPSIEWLESYLQNYPGGFILISHDRRFLNSSVNEILEVSAQDLKSYSGNFDQYLQEKQIQQEIQGNAFKNQQKMIKDTERFITRFRAKATKARQVQSRIKQLEKIQRIEEPTDSRKEINVKFPVSKEPGKIIAECKNLSKSYPEIDIYENAEFLVKRGDKVALIGANGKGKSTFLKIMAGREEYQGKVHFGYNVISEFYAQHQLEELNLENTVVKEALDGLSNKNEKEVRDVLGTFLFSGEEVEKKVKVLSGGEKARLALAKIFLREPNFLLLDEPTNHLDMVSIEILKDALKAYNGSFIVVSHNRDFIEGIANKIWWIESKLLKEYPGNYEEYAHWKSNVLSENKIQPKEVKVSKKKVKSKADKPDPRKSSAEDQKKIKAIKALENEIESLGQKIKEVENELIECSKDFDEEKLGRLKTEYEGLKEKQEELYAQWEELADAL